VSKCTTSVMDYNTHLSPYYFKLYCIVLYSYSVDLFIYLCIYIVKCTCPLDMHMYITCMYVFSDKNIENHMNLAEQ
jgi:hypothetical protein